MGRNADIDSPTIVTVTQSDTVDCPRSLRAIDIFADGDLKVEDVEGTIVTRTFVGIAPCYRWCLQIRKVFNTGTTIADSNLLGLH